MRLIDADKVIEILEFHLTEVDGIYWALRDIEEQPTAYDVKSVVEQLEDKAELTYLNKMEERVGKKRTTGFALGIRAAIEIVKGGQNE